MRAAAKAIPSVSLKNEQWDEILKWLDGRSNWNGAAARVINVFELGGTGGALQQKFKEQIRGI